VYETILQNSQGIIIQHGNLSSTTDQFDGITIEKDIAWTQFLYTSDVWLKVHQLDGFEARASDIIIRPRTLGYTVKAATGDVYIRIPYSEHGARFSIKFEDQVYSFRHLSTVSLLLM
jgi:Glycosyl hydrolase family 49 N-terminal Ig-like domain